MQRLPLTPLHLLLYFLAVPRGLEKDLVAVGPPEIHTERPKIDPVTCNDETESLVESEVGREGRAWGLGGPDWSLGLALQQGPAQC